MSVRTIELVLEATDKASPDIQRVRSGVQGVGGDLGHMKAMAIRAAGALGLAFGAREVLGFLVDTNRETERLKAQLRTFDGGRAGAVFQDIERFASKTPFQIDEITEAYVKLRGIGLNPTEEMLTAFGDTAAAMGKDLVQYAEAVSDAVTGEFERLKEFGIKASTQGDKVKFTFRGQSVVVRKEAGAITKALEDIGRTQFAGGMAEQMDTINGAISNLQDNFGTVARVIGEGGLNDFIKESVRGVTAFTQGLVENRDEVQYWTKIAIRSFQFVVELILLIPKRVKHGVEIIGSLMALVWNGIAWLLNKDIDAINWLISAVDKIPGIDIDFRIGGLEVIDWSDLTAGALDTIGESVRADADDLNDLERAWLGVGSASDRALQQLLRGPSSPKGKGVGGAAQSAADLAKRAAAQGLGLRRRQAAAAAVFGTASTQTPGFAAPLFDRTSAPFSTENLAGAVFAGQRMDPLLGQKVEMLETVGSVTNTLAESYAADMQRMTDATTAFADSVSSSIQSGVIDVFATLGPALVGSLGGVDGGLAALNASIAKTLGDIMVNAGTTIVATSEGFAALKGALFTLMPHAGIAAGLLLIAAGSAMRGSVASFASNPTGAGGGGIGGGNLSLRDFGDVTRGSADRGRIEVHFPSGPALYDPTDYRQREAMKRFIRAITGSREIVIVGG